MEASIAMLLRKTPRPNSDERETPFHVAHGKSRVADISVLRHQSMTSRWFCNPRTAPRYSLFLVWLVPVCPSLYLDITPTPPAAGNAKMAALIPTSLRPQSYCGAQKFSGARHSNTRTPQRAHSTVTHALWESLFGGKKKEAPGARACCFARDLDREDQQGEAGGRPQRSSAGPCPLPATASVGDMCRKVQLQHRQLPHPLCPDVAAPEVTKPAPKQDAAPVATSFKAPAEAKPAAPAPAAAAAAKPAAAAAAKPASTQRQREGPPAGTSFVAAAEPAAAGAAAPAAAAEAAPAPVVEEAPPRESAEVEYLTGGWACRVGRVPASDLRVTLGAHFLAGERDIKCSTSRSATAHPAAHHRPLSPCPRLRYRPCPCRPRQCRAEALWVCPGCRRLHAARGDGAVRLWLHWRQLHR